MTMAVFGNNFNSKIPEVKLYHDEKPTNAGNLKDVIKDGWNDVRQLPQIFPLMPQIDIFKPQVEEKKAPEISGVRVFFNRLTDEQIAQVNDSKQLPKNAKVVDDVAIGKPRLTWNLFDITPGTHKLPAGYELKKDILGFTHLVREGTQAWYLKK